MRWLFLTPIKLLSCRLYVCKTRRWDFSLFLLLAGYMHCLLAAELVSAAVAVAVAVAAAKAAVVNKNA